MKKAQKIEVVIKNIFSLNQVLFVSNEELPFFRSESYGLSIINKLIICEDDGFECITIEPIRPWMKLSDEIDIQLNKNAIGRVFREHLQNTYERNRFDENRLLHFIWAGYTHQGSRPAIYELLKYQMRSHFTTRAILTVVTRWRYGVITKETYEDLYKHGGTLGYEKVEQSMSDEIEYFYNGIKYNKNITTNLCDNQDRISSVHCSIISAEESRKLSNGDKNTRSSYCIHFYQNPDVTDEEMQKSESTLKYAASICIRRSFYIIPI